MNRNKSAFADQKLFHFWGETQQDYKNIQKRYILRLRQVSTPETAAVLGILHGTGHALLYLRPP